MQNEMIPSEIHRTLQINHSKCLSIPEVQQITNYVSKIILEEKKAEKSGRDAEEAIGNGAARKCGRKRMNNLYANIIKQIDAERGKDMIYFFSKSCYLMSNL